MNASNEARSATNRPDCHHHQDNFHSRARKNVKKSPSTYYEAVRFHQNRSASLLHLSTLERERVAAPFFAEQQQSCHICLVIPRECGVHISLLSVSFPSLGPLMIQKGRKREVSPRPPSSQADEARVGLLLPPPNAGPTRQRGGEGGGGGGLLS